MTRREINRLRYIAGALGVGLLAYLVALYALDSANLWSYALLGVLSVMFGRLIFLATRKEKVE